MNLALVEDLILPILEPLADLVSYLFEPLWVGMWYVEAEDKFLMA